MSKAADLANLIGNINAGGGGVNRNIIINGAMNVAQRATSVTGIGGSSGYFVCDRWRINTTTSGRLTMSQDSSAPSGFANSLKLDCTTEDDAIADDESVILSQRIEGQNLQAFAKGTSDAKPMAVSFYVKGNASATYICELRDRDNSRTAGQTFNVTTDWTRVELTFDADTTGVFDDDNARSLDFNIFLHAGNDKKSGTLSNTFASEVAANRAGGLSTSFFDSTSRTFFITGVQLEVGQNPTEFEHEPFERTLAKCQRYYNRHQSNTAYDVVTHGHYSNDTIWIGTYFFPTEMRAEPTLAGSDTWRIYTSSTIPVTSGSLTLTRATTTAMTIEVQTGDNNDIGQGAMMTNNNDSDAHIEFKAEL